LAKSGGYCDGTLDLAELNIIKIDRKVVIWAGILVWGQDE